MEILINYVVPNLALFGTIYLFGKAVEHATWHFICNYDNIVKNIKG
jgi:hypothetical protein